MSVIHPKPKSKLEEALYDLHSNCYDCSESQNGFNKNCNYLGLIKEAAKLGAIGMQSRCIAEAVYWSNNETVKALVSLEPEES